MCDYVFKWENVGTQQSKFFSGEYKGKFQKEYIRYYDVILSPGSFPTFCEINCPCWVRNPGKIPQIPKKQTN